tara:strand:+ start:1031 stop:2218 length:1188 start_codon:yes stop_codon:yes gene_type:complete
MESNSNIIITIFLIVVLSYFLFFNKRCNENFSTKKNNLIEDKTDDSIENFEIETPIVPSVAPGKLLIYYGYPASINNGAGGWYPENTWHMFAKYDYVVLGGGLEMDGYVNNDNQDLSRTPQHGNNVFTKKMLVHLRNFSNTKVYGYIDAGLCGWCKKWNLDQIKTRIDGWKLLGVHGIFVDDFGWDYGVTRERQNEIIRMVHERGMNVCVNGWNVTQIFGNEPDATYNPDGVDTLINSRDYYLNESFVFRTFNDKPADYDTFNNWFWKAYNLNNYRKNIGFGVLAVTTTDNDTPYDEEAFHYAWYCAMLFNYNAIGWGEVNFSASPPNSAVYRERPNINPGFKFTSDVIPSWAHSRGDGVLLRNTNEGVIEILSEIYHKENNPDSEELERTAQLV